MRPSSVQGYACQRTRRIALEDTIQVLRRERFGCVQLFDHYLYLIETLINFSVQVRLRLIPNAC
jgi:hypothetical protein